MNKIKLIAVVALLAITASFFMVTRCWVSFNNTEMNPKLAIETTSVNQTVPTLNNNPKGSENASDSIKTTEKPTPTPTGQAGSSDNVDERHYHNSGLALGTISIATDRRTKTYDFMPDVDEKTLKKNIGHLPSSAMPGQEGVCILMGHRDTDFSILQYVNEGDVFFIETNNLSLRYTVISNEIVDKDNELRFNAQNGVNLILVTCYPFKYTGHAPKKYIVYAEELYLF